MKELKVLIADDHKVVREGLKYILALQDKFRISIEEAEDGKTAVAKAGVAKYNIILMDINMPVLNGVEATKQIIERKPGTKVLALSMHDDEFSVKQMLDAGAQGYVLKNTGEEELIKAIETVSAGGQYFSNEISLKLMAGAKPVVALSTPKRTILTKRELQILQMIASEHTNKEIAEKLFLTKRTVDTHRQKMLNKIGVKNTVGLIKYALENNLLDE